MKIDLTFQLIPRAVIGKPGDVDLADSPDTKLESIALPRGVNVTTLESFAGGLMFCFDTKEKPLLFEDTADCPQ